MKVAKLILCILLVALCSCILPTKQPQLAAASLPENAPILHARLVRVDSSFDDTDLQLRIDVATRLLFDKGIRFSVTDIIPLNSPDWVLVEDSDLTGMVGWTGTAVQTAFLVAKITHNGTEVGGLGYPRPVNCMIISLNSCQDVLAHELAHACGLPHLDVDGNVMQASTCSTADVFNDQQAVTMRACAVDKSFQLSKGNASVLPFVCGAKCSNAK